MAEDGFALPRSSLPEVLKIVHAYFLADQKAKGEAVAVAQVAGHAAMGPTLVSRNNKFLAGIGVVEGGQKKRLTDLGRALGLAVSHGDDELIARALAVIVDESDFLTRVKNAVNIRGGMDVAAVQSHIAISAGVAKNREMMTGANAVVQLLLRSGHLVDDGGTVRATNVAVTDAASRGSDESKASGRSTFNVPHVVSATSTQPRVQWWSSTGAGDFRQRGIDRPNVTINLEINVGTGELEEVRDLLRELLGLPSDTSRADAPNSSDE